MKAWAAAIASFVACTMPAHADIYTWVDRKGVTNVSNLPPPEDARITSVSRTTPKDAAREAAARDASRQAELRVLNERLRELQEQLEQVRREPPISYLPPPPMTVAAPAPYIVNVITAPAPSYAPAGGCDYSFGDCGFGAWPGYYYPPTVFIARSGSGRGFRRFPQAQTQPNTHLVPPLIPLPQPPRMSAPPRRY
jgi:hypothetical protein